MREKGEHFVKEGVSAPEILDVLRRPGAEPLLPALAGRIGSVTYIQRRTAKEFKPLRNVNLSQIVDQFCAKHFCQDKKDHHAMIWGDCVQHRTNDSVQSMEAFAFDFDGTVKLEVIAQALRKAGCAAVIYTTHSHGATKTKFEFQKFKDYRQAQGQPIDLTDIAAAEYLASIGKQHLRNVKIVADHSDDA